MQTQLNISKPTPGATNQTLDGTVYQTTEFWTARQRQGHSLHEISYRACFKPQLPEYFIQRYTKLGDIVADPFMGRGTTPIQAHLMGRQAAGNDANPLCIMMARPRFNPPSLHAISSRLSQVLTSADISESDKPLLAFYHADTLSQLIALKQWFANREHTGDFDGVDDWIRMVCINRLTGHSSGFFSVRTMPPNQAVSIESQIKINEKKKQTPEPRDICAIVLKKSRSLLRSGYPPPSSYQPNLHCTASDRLTHLADESVALVVTSPPFLDIVNYSADNWLRCWFANIDPDTVKLDTHTSIESWRKFIRRTFIELARVVQHDGHIAFEVGEVRNGSIKLEDEVIQAIEGLPFSVEKVMVNQQSFTKTSNLWGIDNNLRGTNTNRIVLIRRTSQ